MNRNERALKLVKKWVAKVGSGEAMRRLVNEKVGFSTADKIVREDYYSTPGEWLTDVLLKEMAKDGLSLPDEKAS